MSLLEVVVEMPLRRECFAAGHEATLVRFLTGVQPDVRLEIAFLVKRFAAAFVRALEVSDALVLLKVNLQSLDAAVRLVAVWIRALELLDRVMSCLVILEVASGHEGLAAPRKHTRVRTVILYK